MSELERKNDKNNNIIAEEVPEPSSSVTLELFTFIHKIYLYIYNIILLLLFIFKRFAFNYEYGPIIGEVIFAILLLFINIIRIRLTSIGNKTERALLLLVAVILGFINLFGYIYFMRIQTFVTYFDVVFSAIGLVIIFFEFLCSAFTMFNIKVHEKNI